MTGEANGSTLCPVIYVVQVIISLLLYINKAPFTSPFVNTFSVCAGKMSTLNVSIGPHGPLVYSGASMHLYNFFPPSSINYRGMYSLLGFPIQMDTLKEKKKEKTCHIVY